MKHDYTSELKKRRKIGAKRFLGETFLELLAEISLTVIAAIIGICAFAIFGVKNPDDELALIIGMLVIGATVAIPFFIYYRCLPKRGERQDIDALRALMPNQTVKIRGTDGLFEALTPLIDGVTKSASGIRIAYGDDVMDVEERKQKFTVSFNGVKENKALDPSETFNLAVEFAHEQRKDISVFPISDRQIKDITDEGIIYTDALGREHIIDIAASVKKCDSEGISGVINRAELSVLFYTGAVKTLVTFKLKIENIDIKKRKKEENEKAFVSFISDLSSHGYILKDILKVN